MIVICTHIGKNYVYIHSYEIKTAMNDHNPNEWLLIDHKIYDLCEGHMGNRAGDSVYSCIEYIPRYFEVANPGYFHFIKVMQIGVNSDITGGSWQYGFYLGAFEIYGTITNIHVSHQGSCIEILYSYTSLPSFILLILFLTTENSFCNSCL